MGGVVDFQITEDRKVVTFFLRNPKRKKACEVYLQYETTKLTTSEIRRLCVALRLQNQSLKFGSQRNAFIMF
jgi:hypothetical protein